jgi:hypothetical protein
MGLKSSWLNRVANDEEARAHWNSPNQERLFA